MATDTPIQKRPKGRPQGAPYRAFNFHCDADLYNWLQSTRGKRSITRVINDIIRKEAGI